MLPTKSERRGCVNMCSRKTPAKPESAAAAHAASTPTTGSGSAGTLKSASVRPASTASSPSGAPVGLSAAEGNWTSTTPTISATNAHQSSAANLRPSRSTEKSAAQSSFVWTSTIDVTAGRLVSAT